jgi:hypothetical protein
MIKYELIIQGWSIFFTYVRATLCKAAHNIIFSTFGKYTHSVVTYQTTKGPVLKRKQ